MQLTSTRQRHFDVDRPTVWAAMSRVGDVGNWWPWLRCFEGAALTTGSVWQCVVQPPLPYSLRITIALDEVIAPRLVEATVAGDVTGDARLVLEEDETGCRAVLRSRLTAQQATLQLVARLAPPLARFGHDWVLDNAAQQFAERVRA